MNAQATLTAAGQNVAQESQSARLPARQAPAQLRGAAETALPRGSKLWIEVAESVAELQPHLAAWNQLAQDAADPNPFYEPWMLVPALEAFATSGQVQLVMVYRDSRRTDSPPEMCGMFPMHLVRLGRWPFHTWRMWQHMYDYSCVPLVRRDCAEDTIRAVGHWIGTEARGASLWDLHHLTTDGLFASSLLEVAREGGWLVHCADSYHRALLRCEADPENYGSEAVTGRTRQEHRRLRRRLADLGRLEVRSTDTDPDFSRWTARFLELEQSGWKGRGETAMADSPDHRQYFETIVAQGSARGQVAMLGLFLNDEPVALKCNFLVPPGSYAFKIAFSEEHYRFSPGVQL
ncbi:MAG: GNAT family N-acetyltransferase, partial [Planctomycetaceae bacterium]|nr:GNAT family N-acetyltransferase [Planctomycetaceae bacterium]